MRSAGFGSLRRGADEFDLYMTPSTQIVEKLRPAARKRARVASPLWPGCQELCGAAHDSFT